MTTTKTQKPRSKWKRRFSFAIIVVGWTALCFWFSELVRGAANHQGWDASDWSIWAVTTFLIFVLGVLGPAATLYLAVMARRKKIALRMNYVRNLSTTVHQRLADSGVPTDLVLSPTTARASIGVHTVECGPMTFDLWVDSTGATWQPVHHHSPQPSRAYVDELFGHLDVTKSAADVVAAIEQHLNNVRRDSAKGTHTD